MILTVHAKPNARRSRLVKELDETTYVVEVAAPPVDGKANKALIEFLAEHFNIPKSSVILKRGMTTRIKQFEILLVALLFVVIGGAGCMPTTSNTQTNTSGNSSEQGNEEQQISIPAGWELFEDGHHVFTIAHPSEWTTPVVQDPYHFLPDVRVGFFTDNASYHPMNYSQDGTLMISSDANVDACYDAVQTGSSQGFTGSTTINNITFRTATFSDAGAGNRYDTTVYRTVHGGTCFEIATTLHSASDWTDVDQNAIDASQKAMNDEMKMAVDTFEFAE